MENDTGWLLTQNLTGKNAGRAGFTSKSKNFEYEGCRDPAWRVGSSLLQVMCDKE